MKKIFDQPVFEHGSAEYEGYISDLMASKVRQNCRNEYTKALRKGLPFPTGHMPPDKPTTEDLQRIQYGREWGASLRGRPDEWWFNRIDSAIEDPFYRSKVSQLIWWEICNGQKTCKELWRPRWEAWDFDADLFCDWDLVEYALHCCGFSPYRARAIATEAEGRKQLRQQGK